MCFSEVGRSRGQRLYAGPACCQGQCYKCTCLQAWLVCLFHPFTACVSAIALSWCHFAGSIGAARSRATLKALGISHIVNASPLVPCFHRHTFKYKTVTVYDDADEDIRQHFQSTNQFISEVCCLCTAIASSMTAILGLPWWYSILQVHSNGDTGLQAVSNLAGSQLMIMT